MNQKLIAETQLDDYKKTWRITLPLSGEDSVLLRVEFEGKETLRIVQADGIVTASVLFSGRETPCVLQGRGNAGDILRLENADHRIVLWIGDRLMDEDWPIGKTLAASSVCLEAAEGASFEDWNPQGEEQPDVLRTFRWTQGWRPEGENASAGDCMPFSEKDRFHLFYLFDRRHHASKWGLGAHQWAHISTTDLVNWEEHPRALAIDRQEEGSICTGSVICHNGEYRAFYAVRMSDGTPAQLTWATSSDGIHFEKSGKSFALHEPYDPVNARDPKVFVDANGLFHMLITTAWQKNGEDRGCLAHFTSHDLETWEEQEPALTLDVSDHPECSDYFQKDGYSYLIYSVYSVAHYLVSKEPFGPWTKPENDVVVGDWIHVPKSAYWKDGRILFAGFVQDIPGLFGGSIRFYEAKVQPDGTLAFFDVPEMAGE